MAKREAVLHQDGCDHRAKCDYHDWHGEGLTILHTPQTTTEEMVRALAIALRDKTLADARQAMKLVREIERKYGLTPANAKER
jgi:hypothetical protein